MLTPHQFAEQRSKTALFLLSLPLLVRRELDTDETDAIETVTALLAEAHPRPHVVLTKETA